MSAELKIEPPSLVERIFTSQRSNDPERGPGRVWHAECESEGPKGSVTVDVWDMVTEEEAKRFALAMMRHVYLTILDKHRKERAVREKANPKEPQEAGLG